MNEDDAMRKSGISENERGSRGCDIDEWWTERGTAVKIVMGIGFGILGIGLLFFFGWIVMILWNWLMPDLFGLPSVTYWKAWGLLLLCSILFKGKPFGSDNGGGRSERKRKKTLRRYIADEVEKEIEKEIEGEIDKEIRKEWDKRNNHDEI